MATRDRYDEKSPLLQPESDSNRSRSPGGGIQNPEVSVIDSHQCTNLECLMNLMKANIGTGLLGLPYAVQHAGIILGPLSLIVMSVICISCMLQLVGTSKRLCQQDTSKRLDYADVAREAINNGGIQRIHGYGYIGSHIVNAFLLITQLGFCCVYFIFMADNVQEIYYEYYGSAVPDVKLFVLMLFVPVVLICFIRNLDELAPLSIIAIILTIVGIGFIYEHFVTSLIDEGPANVTFVTDDFWKNYPYFFGSSIYAFEGIGVVLPMEVKMKNPEDFTKVLVVGMILVTILYTSMGFLGYLTFGETVKETITLSLPTSGIFTAVKLMFVAAIFVTYAVQFYVPAYIVWPFFKGRIPGRFHDVGNYVFRASLVGFTMILAVSIPQLANFITLIGAFSSSALAIILPPLFEEIVRCADGYHGCNFVRLLKNSLVFFLGLVGMVMGTYVAILSIIEDFQKNS